MIHIFMSSLSSKKLVNKISQFKMLLRRLKIHMEYLPKTFLKNDLKANLFKNDKKISNHQEMNNLFRNSVLPILTINLIKIHR